MDGSLQSCQGSVTLYLYNIADKHRQKYKILNVFVIYKYNLYPCSWAVYSNMYVDICIM